MPEQLPRVSVIVPTYNSARYLPEAIDSVLGQTYRDFEIIVVDDGSTDNTQGVLARYAEQIRVVRQSNQGSAAARNAGILAARGEFIAFLDADDLWLPQKLERQMPLFDERPEIGWVYSDYREFGESGLSAQSFFERQSLCPPPEGRVLLALARDCITSTITVVIRASCLQEAGLFDRTFRRAQDYDMWLRLAARFPVGCVDDVLALYRQHTRAVSYPDGFGWYCTWRVFLKFMRGTGHHLSPDLRQRAMPLARRMLAVCAAGVARAALRRGHHWLAFRWRLKALAAALRGPVSDRQLLAWHLGQLLDTFVPASAMRAARRVRAGVASLSTPLRCIPRQGDDALGEDRLDG